MTDSEKSCVKHIILCADDYGQNDSISQAIIDLISKKRLSATSCLTTSSQWLSQAKALLPFNNQVDIGLHFNLTEGRYLTQPRAFFPSLKTLLCQAFLRKLDENLIESELNAQIDQFIAGMGQLPDFIDGHQHIQQFPVIRDILIKVYRARFKNHRIFLRCLGNPFNIFNLNKAYFKQFVLQYSGAIPFKMQLIANNIPYNSSFSGIYNFSPYINYDQLFRQFLIDSLDNGLIMCHPGLPVNGKNHVDKIYPSRLNEYHFYSSQAFVEICDEMRVGVRCFRWENDK